MVYCQIQFSHESFRLIIFSRESLVLETIVVSVSTFNLAKLIVGKEYTPTFFKKTQKQQHPFPFINTSPN